METKHTPLEIKQVATSHFEGEIILSDGTYIYYGSMTDPLINRVEALDYANHLIKCVNNHERLVGMVEKLQERLKLTGLSGHQEYDLNQQATQLLTDLKK